jgi:tetratricopeptide (TPR) repeat protein
MHELINKLAFSLFKKNSLEECKVEEIEELVKQYPYFSSAQLLLAAKQKQAGDPGFQNQLTTTSLHVTNPFWLDHLLSSQPLEEEKAVKETLAAAEVNFEPNNDELVLERNRREFIAASDPEVEIKEEQEVIVVPDPAPPVVQKKETTQDDKLVFEPYYTVDYFASQGIKNVIEERPKDRFSQQLKSFTEWLKAIRQMPQQDIAALSDSRSEEKVAQLASHSLAEENVETEAMAEVWIKQGQPEKAIRIYEKLSLLNPPKSSYFASLIENLKKS